MSLGRGTIALFSRATAAFLLAVTAATGNAIGEESSMAHPDLTGVVKDDTGQPLGNATVFIYTAGPRKGAGVLCPSCYADCRKRTTTDADGRFTITSLDPSLLFRVLVVAKDRRPEFVAKVDPAEKPIEVTLKRRTGGDSAGKRLQGRVIDPDGEPVMGAVINIRGVTRGQGTRFGGNTNIDPVAVSDETGAFLISGSEPFDASGVDIDARGFAKGVFQRLATGDTNHILKLKRGVTLKGKVTKGGKPLPGVEIGVAGAERRSEIFVGDYSVASDDNGEFLFSNLPANTEYELYGLMKSLAEHGAIPTRRVSTGGDETTLDVGELKVEPGYEVSGQLRLMDGKPLTTNVHVMLSRRNAWDTQQAEATADGRFRFAGVPTESVSISARLKGYRLSLRNASLDLFNPSHLIGHISANKRDMVLELEPGDRRESLSGGSTRALEQEPLRGAEGGANATGDIKVVGRVIDADTQQPIPSFTTVEGRQEPYGFNQVNWFSSRAADQSNGAFTVYFKKQPQPPAVLIEAPGYVPQSSGAVTTTETNVTISLKKGSGPSGVVLTSDGKRAVDVKVYLTDMRNGVYVSETNLQVRDNIYRGTRSTTTDAEGRFKFKPQVDDFSVIVIDEAGFANVPVEELRDTGKVQLQPIGRVEGQLLIGTKPGTNETVRLGLAHVPYASHPRSFYPLSLFLTTVTDANGHFVFPMVPPIPVQVAHQPKVRDARTGTIPESQTVKFQLKPGELRKLTLGGKGRPVVGRVEITNYEDTVDWRNDVQSLETVVPAPPELPDLMAASREFSNAYRAADTDEEKRKLRAEFDAQREKQVEQTRAFYASDAGRDHHFKSRRFVLNFAQDGSFRVEDVPGGNYKLRLNITEPDAGRPMGRSIARTEKEIEIPESPDGRSDEPFDLGTITLTGQTTMKTGKMAPDFAVKTIDGKPLKLSDFRGKHVLLDFWAVWCGPCVAETPHLKEAWNAFKDDSRFTMIGLSLDPDIAAPRNYAKKNELGWIQGFLGDWSKSDVPATFGVQGIPSIFLIGPDGKIVEQGLRGANIKRAVEKALGNPTQQVSAK